MPNCETGTLFLHLKILDFITSLEIGKAADKKASNII